MFVAGHLLCSDIQEPFCFAGAHHLPLTDVDASIAAQEAVREADTARRSAECQQRVAQVHAALEHLEALLDRLDAWFALLVPDVGSLWTDGVGPVFEEGPGAQVRGNDEASLGGVRGAVTVTDGVQEKAQCGRGDEGEDEEEDDEEEWERVGDASDRYARCRAAGLA